MVTRKKVSSKGLVAAKSAKKTLRAKKIPSLKTAAPRKKIVKPIVTQPISAVSDSQAIEASESKFYAGPVIQKFAAESKFEFPAGYGDNKIVLMVRDPYWLYTYWEINLKRIEEIRRELGEALFLQCKKMLRVYNVNNWHSFDLVISPEVQNWYIRVPLANASYCVDIGFLSPDGRFVAAARSNVVTTPLDRMSDVVDEQWMIPDWDKLYSISGGFGLGKSSEELSVLWKQRLESESASGWVSSGSPVKKVGQRPFWLWVKTEVIVYGATEPSATVTLQGRKINLRPDGTFSVRYELPEGFYNFPVEAIRDDGLERRKITPTVERKTD